MNAFSEKTPGYSEVVLLLFSILVSIPKNNKKVNQILCFLSGYFQP